MEKVGKARALLSNSHPEGLSFEQLFELMLDEYLDRHSLEGRIRRRNARKAKKRELESWEADQGEKEDQSKARHRDKRLRSNKNRSRCIPRAVRDAVYVRDGGRCTFVGTDGVRCDAERNLQIDHIVPYARGGDNSLDNLRLLCAKHNRHAAEREYGKQHMKKYYIRERGKCGRGVISGDTYCNDPGFMEQDRASKGIMFHHPFRRSRCGGAFETPRPSIYLALTTGAVILSPNRKGSKNLKPAACFFVKRRNGDGSSP
jgi:5-methylcytosine-specific restriction endonuclease McrA